MQLPLAGPPSRDGGGRNKAEPAGRGWNVRNGTFPDFFARILITMAGLFGRNGLQQHQNMAVNFGFQSKRKARQRCLRNQAKAE